MAIYAKKTRAEILQEALYRLQSQTPITAISPGSIARAFTESITEQLGDMYDALEYNLAQSVLSTATGRSLDLLGQLYNVKRRTLSDLAATDAKVGAFYFALQSVHNEDVTIPGGTKVFTGVDSFIGRQLSFETSTDVTIPAGRTRVWASIRPSYNDSSFSAAPNTLLFHNFIAPPGVTVTCTNPKPIAPQMGYETDDNFRLRITKAVRVASSGTVEAVRFAGLNVNGIRDITIRQAPYGMGTFEVIIVAENPSDTAAVFAAARAAMDGVRPVGVRMISKQPNYVSFDFGVSLVLGSSFVEPNILDMVRIAVLRYVNSLLPGKELVYNRLIQVVMDVSPAIKDVRVTRFAPRGIEAVRRNLTVKTDEQIIPGGITVQTAS